MLKLEYKILKHLQYICFVHYSMESRELGFLLIVVYDIAVTDEHFKLILSLLTDT